LSTTSSSSSTTSDANKQATSINVKLGPGQLQPKGYRLTTGRYGELKMSFIAVKGILDVEVSDQLNCNISLTKQTVLSFG
jgi:hypothetical protein